jgi:hypothetical protein
MQLIMLCNFEGLNLFPIRNGFGDLLKHFRNRMQVIISTIWMQRMSELTVALWPTRT